MAAVSTHTFDSVLLTATDVAAVPATDELHVRDLSITRSVDMADLTCLGDALKTSAATVGSIEISCSGDLDAASAPLTALRTAFDTKAMVWLTIITNPGATVGIETGKRYGVFCSSLNLAYAVSGVVTFDASFALGSATITSVLAA